MVPELDLVERRHGDVDVAAVDQLRHLPVEERQDERADVRAVDVGVGHHDHAVVAQLRDVELVADPGADRGDHRLDLVVGEDLVDPVLLRVDDLSAQGQDRLVGAVAAHLGRAARGVALDDEELGRLGILDRAVGELARERAVLERALAARQLARLPRCLARPRGGDRLRDDLARVLRVLLEELGELRVHGRLDEAGDRRVAELRLRLALELRVRELHRDDGCEALANVLALEVVLLLLQQPFVLGVLVQRARERRTEALQVGAALVGVDVVRERVDGVDVGGVPLHRHLDVAVLALTLEEDDVLVDGVLRVVDVGDEVADPALGVELVALLALALVEEDDPKAAREERGLAQALHERLQREVDLLEDLGVGQERDRRAGVALVGLAGDLDVGQRDAALELLAVDVAVALHLRDEPLRQRVHDRDADPVQAAGDLVAVAAELAAGVELGQDDRQRREALLLDHLHGDARATVRDGDRVVRMEDDLDVVVPAGEGLVDGVVDHLVDEMMEPAGPGRADVHPGPQPDGLEALQNGDVLCGVSSLSH
jgi:hypothetical protein